MRILVISPLFPPVADSEAFCSGKFVQGLLDCDHDPVVIFCTNTRSESRMDLSNNWRTLEKVSVDVPYWRSPSLLRRICAAMQFQTSSWSGWVQAAVAKAKELHRREAFDLVVSRSLPGHAHLAGYWISSALKLPWLANVNDPWDFSPFIANDSKRKEWRVGLNMKLWWRRIAARADGLTFPCERLKDHCMKGSGRKSGIFVIPHIGSSPRTSGGGSEFLIVHAGKLGMDDVTGRSARPLIEGVAGLLKNRPAAKALVRLVIVGSLDSDAVSLARELGVANNMTTINMVSYEESLEHIANASICVLVEGNFKEGIFLPSKLCDYIAARKPVVAFSPDCGSVNDLTRAGGIHRVSPLDSLGAITVFTKLFDAFLEDRLSAQAPPEELADQFEPSVVTKSFLQVVDSLVARQPRRGSQTIAPIAQ